MAALPFGSICTAHDERCIQSICTHEIQASVQLSWANVVSKGKIRIQGGACCTPFNLILACLILGLSLRPASCHRLSR